jgi:hypothetical protein
MRKTAMSKTLELRSKVRNEVLTEMAADPQHRADRAERYKRMLRDGTVTAFQVIARAEHDQLADRVVRQYIAELLECGDDGALTAQLRAYAVKYLVNPIHIMRRFDNNTAD